MSAIMSTIPNDNLLCTTLPLPIFLDFCMWLRQIGRFKDISSGSAPVGEQIVPYPWALTSGVDPHLQSRYPYGYAPVSVCVPTQVFVNWASRTNAWLQGCDVLGTPADIWV